MFHITNTVSLGDRPPIPLKQGKHWTITEKRWWDKVRAITDVTHIGEKNTGKPREQFDYNHMNSDLKTALKNLGRIEGKIKETQWISNKKIIKCQLKTSAYTCGKKVKNWKLSMKQETTVL